MNTKIEKSPNHPFALNEQELRRILDLMLQQVGRVAAQTVQTQFTIEFRNGSVASPVTLDEILSQENYGSISMSAFK